LSSKFSLKHILSFILIMDSLQPSSPVGVTESPLPTADPSEPPPALSKNAQKRLLKAQKREEFKHERRAREKAAKAAKKAAKREQATKAVDANTTREGESADEERVTKKRKLVDGEALAVRGDGEEGSSPDTKTNFKHIRKEPFGAKIVIDLGFDEKMTDRVSLSSRTNARKLTMISVSLV
jgi:tRNA (guanine9-N1)-methyltransferase